MEQLRTYLLSVTAVCMLCVICLQLVELPRIKGVLRFISGLLVLLVAASALVTLDVSQLEKFAGNMELNLNLSQSDLEQEVRSELAVHVQTTTENYIEKYASELGITVQAKVVVSEDKYPVPIAVTIIGTVDPHQKAVIEQYLFQSLNIPYDRQEWK